MVHSAPSGIYRWICTGLYCASIWGILQICEFGREVVSVRVSESGCRGGFLGFRSRAAYSTYTVTPGTVLNISTRIGSICPSETETGIDIVCMRCPNGSLFFLFPSSIFLTRATASAAARYLFMLAATRCLSLSCSPLFGSCAPSRATLVWARKLPSLVVSSILRNRGRGGGSAFRSGRTLSSRLDGLASQLWPINPSSSFVPSLAHHRHKTRG